jgi:hypothetical protein
VGRFRPQTGTYLGQNPAFPGEVRFQIDALRALCGAEDKSLEAKKGRTRINTDLRPRIPRI